MKIIDMCICEEDKKVYKKDARHFMEEWNGWRGYYNALMWGSLDEIWFRFEDIDRSVFIVEDGGDVIRLKSGEYVSVCWRGLHCRVWSMWDDKETTEMYDDYRKREV